MSVVILKYPQVCVAVHTTPNLGVTSLTYFVWLIGCQGVSGRSSYPGGVWLNHPWDGKWHTLDPQLQSHNKHTLLWAPLGQAAVLCHRWRRTRGRPHCLTHESAVGTARATASNRIGSWSQNRGWGWQHGGASSHCEQPNLPSCSATTVTALRENMKRIQQSQKYVPQQS